MDSEPKTKPATPVFLEQNDLFDLIHTVATENGIQSEQVLQLLRQNAILQGADEVSYNCASFSLAIAQLLSGAQDVEVPEQLLRFRHDREELFELFEDFSVGDYEEKLGKILQHAAASHDSIIVEVPKQDSRKPDFNKEKWQERIAEITRNIIENISRGKSSRFLFIEDQDSGVPHGIHWATIAGCVQTDGKDELMLLEKEGPGAKIQAASLSEKIYDMSLDPNNTKVRIIIPRRSISEIVREALREE